MSFLAVWFRFWTGIWQAEGEKPFCFYLILLDAGSAQFYFEKSTLPYGQCPPEKTLPLFSIDRRKQLETCVNLDFLFVFVAIRSGKMLV